MTTRVLAFILAAAAGGCVVESTPSEQTETQELGEPKLVAVSGEGEAQDGRLPTTPSTLYARSGDLKPGEEQSGPFPEPWQQRMGPFPEPWGPDHASDNGSSGSNDPNNKP